MNANSENEFYDVTMNELLPITLKQWRKILLIGMIIAVLFGLFKFVTLYNIANNAELTTNIVTEKELLQKSVKDIQSKINLKEKELDESIYYNLEPSSIETGFISYYIDTPIKDADLGYQKNLVNSYATYFISGEIYNEIANQLSEYIKPAYLSQIIIVENSGLSSFNIYVMGANKNQANEIMQLLKQNIINIESEVSSIVSEHTIRLISENITVTSNAKVFDDQEFQKTRLEALKTELSDKNSQLQIIESTSLTKVGLLISVLKFSLIGLLAGISFAMIFFSIVSIVSNNIKSRKQILNNYGIDVLGEFVQENKKNNKLDIFLSKLLGEAYELTEVETNLIIANHIIAMSKSKKVVIFGSKDITSTKKIFDDISTCNILSDYDIGYSDKPLNNYETLASVLKYDSVIIIVKKNKTSLNELQNAVYTINSYGKDLVGVIFA